MGFLDAVLGKSRLPKPKPDKLFAISTACITLSTNLNLKSEGAGICFKPFEASRFQNTELEINELLARSCKERIMILGSNCYARSLNPGMKR